MTHPIALASSVVFLQHFFSNPKAKFAYLFNYLSHALPSLLLQLNLFWIELTYFLFLSAIGYGALKLCNNTTAAKDLDIFFMSVSASTVSSMSTIEMEVFSNFQLIILTLLMLAGGEVFSSLIGLELLKLKSKKYDTTDSDHSSPRIVLDHIVVTTNSQIEVEKPDDIDEPNPDVKCKSLEFMFYVVLCYLVVTHVVGCILVYIYTIAVSSAKHILKKKGINLMTFSAFVVASTFANVGFIPTNENMVVFKKNSGLLVILIPQILMGNTLYPACLRFIIWVIERKTKRAEFSYILRNSSELGYSNMLSGLYTKSLVITVVGFIMFQFVWFCALEWYSEATIGLSNYEKIVGSLFEVINSRHCGESAFDFSLITPPILLLFVVMMYLPPTTCFAPFKEKESDIRRSKKMEKQKSKFSNVYVLFSPLGYLVVCIFLICVAEREKMRDDPLNFNVFNIVLEVISAYGNVGFSMGYSCEKQINKNSGQYCKDATYGFVGRWSNLGRFILIIVMFGGRLKKFGINGGKPWKFL